MADFLIEKYGFKKFGKLTVQYAGTPYDYYTTIYFIQNRYEAKFTVTIGATISSEDAKNLNSQLSQIKGFISFHQLNHALQMQFNQATLKRKERLEQVLDTCYNYLKQIRAETGCFYTGINDDTIKLIDIEGRLQYLSASAIEKESQVFEKNKAQAPNNLAMGLIGALIGSVVGAILWAVLLWFGYYAWFAAIIGVILAFSLYRKFGGPVNIMGSVLIILMLILCLLIANRAVYAYGVYQGLEGELGLWEIFMNLGYYLEDIDQVLREHGKYSNFVSSYSMDNILGVGIAAIFGIVYYFIEYRKAIKENTIKEVE